MNMFNYYITTHFIPSNKDYNSCRNLHLVYQIYPYSFASACFLSLLFHLIHQCLHAIPTKALLYYNSNTHFLSINLLLVIIFVIQRQIHGKWVQIVVGGMGSPVIKLLVMSLALTLLTVSFKVQSIPIAPFSLFTIYRGSTLLTTISITLQFHLSLVDLRTWHILTSLDPSLLVNSHPKSPT